MNSNSSDSDTPSHNPNAAPIQRSEPNARGETIRTKAVMSLVKQNDGHLLAVKVGGKWTLPGAVSKPGELEEDCQRRGLRECVGTTSGPAVKVYEGPNSIVYVAAVTTEGGRGKLPFAWLTEAQFLVNATNRPLFEKVFAAARTQDLAQSKLISKLKDGRILFAIQYEVYLERLKDWEMREAHYVHAMNAQLAREQFMGNVQPGDPPVRIIAVAPAIGFFETKDGLVG